MTVSSDSLLDVRALRKTYSSGETATTVLADVSFQLAPREHCAIVGPSGSGKTTLLALCAGLDTPSEGSVRLLGEDLGSLDEEGRARLRRQAVGFVFQDFRLIPTLTALENVLVPLELRGERWNENLAAELLARVGLGHRLQHLPSQLSGGEQQRVALARAFAGRPRVLFADEPTGNLDAETSGSVEDHLFQLPEESDTTLVVVTHDTELAARCGRRLELRGGRLVRDSAAASVADAPETR